MVATAEVLALQESLSAFEGHQRTVLFTTAPIQALSQMHPQNVLIRIP